MTTKVFDSIIILTFGIKIIFRIGKTNVAKEEFYFAKNPINIWLVDVDNIIISKLIERNNYSEFLIGYLDEVITPSVLILAKIIGYFSKINNGDKVKSINNKRVSL